MGVVSWTVIPHRAFDEWYDELEDKEREHVRARVDFLAQNGPGVRRPRSSGRSKPADTPT